MRKKIFLFITALLFISVSCNFPFYKKPTEVVIASMFVSPPQGTSSFELALSYGFTIEADHSPAEILCSYSTPGGSAFYINGVRPSLDDTNYPNQIVTGTKQFSFTIQPVNGKIETGTYTASCATQYTGSEVTSTFYVYQDQSQTNSVPEATATSTVTPNPQATATPEMLFGTISVYYDSVQTDHAGAAGELHMVTNGCTPDVTIAADGSINAKCEISGTLIQLTQETYTATITGNAVRGGSFNFVYEIYERGPNGWNLEPGHYATDTEVWSSEAFWKVTYVATGSFTSPTEASGTAAFTYSCDSGAGNLYWCYKYNKEEYSGTIPWNFRATP